MLTLKQTNKRFSWCHKNADPSKLIFVSVDMSSSISTLQKPQQVFNNGQETTAPESIFSDENRFLTSFKHRWYLFLNVSTITNTYITNTYFEQ